LLFFSCLINFSILAQGGIAATAVSNDNTALRAKAVNQGRGGRAPEAAKRGAWERVAKKVSQAFWRGLGISAVGRERERREREKERPFSAADVFR